MYGDSAVTILCLHSTRRFDRFGGGGGSFGRHSLYIRGCVFILFCGALSDNSTKFSKTYHTLRVSFMFIETNFRVTHVCIYGPFFPVSTKEGRGPSIIP